VKLRANVKDPIQAGRGDALIASAAKDMYAGFEIYPSAEENGGMTLELKLNRDGSNSRDKSSVRRKQALFSPD